MTDKCPTSLDCAQRLLSLFRRAGHVNDRTSVGYLAIYFQGRGFLHEEYRRAIDFAHCRQWIAFPADNSVQLTALGRSVLAQQNRLAASAILSSPKTHSGSR